MSQPEHNTTIEKWFLRSIDLSLAVTLVGTVLAMGGRHPIGEGILVLGTAVCGILWCLFRIVSPAPRFRWTWTFLEIPAVLALGMIFFQVVSLAPETLSAVSPNLQELLPAWNAVDAQTSLFGPWTTVSVAPESTRQCLALIAAAVVYFFVLFQRIRTASDVHRCLKFLALSTSVVSIFAITQFAIGNGKFYGFYQHPSTNTLQVVKGPFTNENHFSHFAMLGVGVLLWWFRTLFAANQGSNKFRGARTISVGVSFVGCCLCVNLLAILLTGSRGGIAITVLLIVFQLLATRKTDNTIPAKQILFLVVAAVVLTVSWASPQGFLTLIDSPYRWIIWTANLENFQEFPMLGTGLGTHRLVHQLHVNIPYYHREFSHADGSFFQILSEGGALLSIVLAIAFALIYFLTRSGEGTSQQDRFCKVCLGWALGFHLIHSVLDFIWYVPGCMIPVLLILACQIRLGRPREVGDPKIEVHRTQWLPRFAYAAVVIAIAIPAWSFQNQLPGRVAHRINYDEVKAQIHAESDRT